MSSDIESYTGSGSETLLSEVLDTIAGQADLRQVPGVLERFWDMFVVDAFINNNDRNNGNWGLVIDWQTQDTQLAPVFDNGNAFFNKRSLAQMEKSLGDVSALQNEACANPQSAYKYLGLDNEGHKIRPFTYFAETNDTHCKDALRRFVQAADMSAIAQVIDEVPETMGNQAVMPRLQKDYYRTLLELRLEKMQVLVG